MKRSDSSCGKPTKPLHRKRMECCFDRLAFEKLYQVHEKSAFYEMVADCQSPFSLLGKAFVLCFGCHACCSPPCFYSHSGLSRPGSVPVGVQ